MKKSEIRALIIKAHMELDYDEKPNRWYYRQDFHPDINSEKFRENISSDIWDITDEEFNKTIEIINKCFTGATENAIWLRNEMGHFFFSILRRQRSGEVFGECIHDALRDLFYEFKLMGDR